MSFRLYSLLIISFFSYLSCQPPTTNKGTATSLSSQETNPVNLKPVELTLEEANRLAQLPLDCIQHPLPYKSGLVIAEPSDLKMPIEHHPAFYGCFDWHSAVHGHWSLIYLLKEFPDLKDKELIMKKLGENLTKANILKELEYFSLNKQTKSFERTYGWAWLLKLSEELYTWDHPKAKEWYSNLKPLATHISKGYQDFLPKLVYPIRVGEHSNTAFGLVFALDYAQTVGDATLEKTIKDHALRLYSKDADCPITWEPSGFDFLSPCLQEMDLMQKVLDKEGFTQWSTAFLPTLFKGQSTMKPAEVLDRSDGKLVHLDGLNFSRAWCLYNIKDNNYCRNIADQHLNYSLGKITDGDYAGGHWLASFALYAFKCSKENQG